VSAPLLWRVRASAQGATGRGTGPGVPGALWSETVRRVRSVLHLNPRATETACPPNPMMTSDPGPVADDVPPPGELGPVRAVRRQGVAPGHRARGRRVAERRALAPARRGVQDRVVVVTGAALDVGPAVPVVPGPPVPGRLRGPRHGLVPPVAARSGPGRRRAAGPAASVVVDRAVIVTDVAGPAASVVVDRAVIVMDVAGPAASVVVDRAVIVMDVAGPAVSVVVDRAVIVMDVAGPAASVVVDRAASVVDDPAALGTVGRGAAATRGRDRVPVPSGVRAVGTIAGQGRVGATRIVGIATQAEPRRPIVRGGPHVGHRTPIVHRPHRRGRRRSGSTRE